jgi:saccharopine dehydrogenase-like NADP-dependent oxidoreductase
MMSLQPAALLHFISFTLFSNGGYYCLALNVLVVGGAGRVGGSTVRWLTTLSDRQQHPISITVGGRRSESYQAALQNKVIPSDGVNFLSMDIDGDESELKKTLEQWKNSCTSSSPSSSSAHDKICIHTGGPFQGRRSPILLRSCIELSMPYVDVCDEWELAETSKVELDRKAKDAGVPAIVSCGIWPGVSALMAAEGVAKLKKKQKASEEVEIESIEYSFFTAGTGNAGPTIVSATFLLLATPVITFMNGIRQDKEPWTEMKEVDFGNGIGVKPVWLLDNPDVPTTALYLNPDKKPSNCSSRFGTDPLPWNYLFGAMKALPRSLLYNRDAMQKFALFSEPIIRFVDKLVGATNAMRVDVTATNGDKVTLRIAHPDLEQCVGLATAAFALEMVKGLGEQRTVKPGVWFPSEISEQARKNILEVSKEDAFVYEL